MQWTFEFNTDDYFFERSVGLQINLLFPMIESCRAGQIGRCLILACLILHWPLVFLTLLVAILWILCTCCSISPYLFVFVWHATAV